MVTSYPGALDAWSNPGANTQLDDTGFEHDVVHSNELDAIEAIEAELGTNPKGGTASVKDRLDYMGRAAGRTAAAWPSASYVTSNLNFGTNGAQAALAADTVYYVAWWCPLTTSIDRIAVEVSTGGAGNARLGIYSPAASGYPGALLLDAGTVDTTAAAIKELTVSQALVGGTQYWLAVHSSATPSLRTAAGGGVVILPIATTAYGTFGAARITEAASYAGGLPTTATTTPTTSGATSNAPMFWIRRA